MFPSILGFLASAYFQGNIRQLHPLLQVVFRAAYMALGQVGGALRDPNSSFFSFIICKIE